MAEVVAYVHEGQELVYDTDDIDTFETPRDVTTVWHWSEKSSAYVPHHEFGPDDRAHLNITFKPGKHTFWRLVTGDEPEEPYAKPLPCPVPTPLADAIRDATWTEL